MFKIKFVLKNGVTIKTLCKNLKTTTSELTGKITKGYRGGKACIYRRFGNCSNYSGGVEAAGQ